MDSRRNAAFLCELLATGPSRSRSPLASDGARGQAYIQQALPFWNPPIRGGEILANPSTEATREGQNRSVQGGVLIHFNEMVEYDSFKEHLKSLPSETDIVLESEDRDSFPIEYAPKFIRDLVEDLAKYSSVPVSIPFLSVVAMYSAALGKNLRVQTGADRTTPGNLFAVIFADSSTGKSDLFRKIATPLVDRQKADRERFEKDVRPKLQGLLDIKLGQMDEVKKEATGKVKSADYEDQQNATNAYIQLQKEVVLSQVQVTSAGILRRRLHN
jgi:uncharacterized protein DUF3987